LYRLRKWGWGWGQLYAGMDGDGDDLETSCGDRGGMGIRVPRTVGDAYKYMFPCSSLEWGYEWRNRPLKL